MKRRAVALVAHENASMRRQVQTALRTQDAEAVYARTCGDVQAALEGGKSPDVILTGTSFANGRWRDVLTLARMAKPPVDVVLTIDEIDLSSDPGSDSLHLENMDQEAFDLVVLPFGANVAQVLTRRLASPRALQPRLWRRLDSRVRRSGRPVRRLQAAIARQLGIEPGIAARSAANRTRSPGL